MIIEKKATKTDASIEGRHEKKTDKIKVMIKRPGKDSFEPFLCRLSTTGFCQGPLVQIYGRPYPDASDRILKVEKLVFRTDKDLNTIVSLVASCIFGSRLKRLTSMVSEEEIDVQMNLEEKKSRFLHHLINHPAIEVNPTLFPGRRRIGTSPA